MIEKCIRCGKPTPYHPNTPITLRRYFVEGSGQLCEKCFYELYPMPVSLQSNLDTGLDQRLEDATLPVDGIEFTYDTHESTEHIAIYGEDSIMAIVKNITDGSETRIDKFGRVGIRESV